MRVEYVSNEFVKYYERYKDATMVPWQGAYDAYQAAIYIAKNDINGDVVECGVFRGGISAIMRDVVNDHSSGHYTHWLFDTFEGMSVPSEFDFKHHMPSYEQTKLKFDATKHPVSGSNWCRGELDDVRATMERFPSNKCEIKYIKGMVEKTLLDGPLPEKISILRLDTDFYESTKIEFNVLFPRLVFGGILIVDDYGSWAGSRKATDEYLNKLSGIKLATFFNHANGSMIAIKNS